MAVEKPAFSQLRISNELKKEGIIVLPGGVRSKRPHRSRHLSVFFRATEAISVSVSGTVIPLTVPGAEDDADLQDLINSWETFPFVEFGSQFQAGGYNHAIRF